MRVGVNARTFNVDQPDGAVQSARKLTRRLSQRNDTELVLFGDSELGSQFESADTLRSNGFLSNSPFYGVLWERTILPCLVWLSDIDVLICPNANAPTLPIETPVVTYVHDVNAQKGMSSGIHGLYRRSLVPPGVNHSDAIVTVSEFSKSEIVRHLPVSESDVHVVYNGVDELFFEEGDGEVLDLPDKYLLYVGAMNPRKNVERLVRAYDQIRDSISHSLVLIGPDNKSLYQDLDIPSLDDDLVLPGFVSAEQLKYAYKHADGFVFPSLYEGFGLPPLEALACGTPVITSNTSSLDEVVTKGSIRIDPTDINEISDAMIRICEDDELCDRLRDEGNDYVKQFTWDRASEELYAAILETV